MPNPGITGGNRRGRDGCREVGVSDLAEGREGAFERPLPGEELR